MNPTTSPSLFRKACVALCAVGAIGVCGAAAHAQDSTSTRFNKSVSGPGTLLYLGVGIARPLLTGKSGLPETVRTADSLISSLAFTEGLKVIVRERRPDDKDERNSFPSGHTTAAFAVATMEAHYHPKEALYWYGGAALIAESRVGLHRHYIHDVVAGAAIGYFTAQWAIKSPRGLLLSPIIRTDTKEKGLAITWNY